MKNSLCIHKWTHNEFNIFILGVLTHPLFSDDYCTNRSWQPKWNDDKYLFFFGLIQAIRLCDYSTTMGLYFGTSTFIIVQPMM